MADATSSLAVSAEADCLSQVAALRRRGVGGSWLDDLDGKANRGKGYTSYMNSAYRRYDIYLGIVSGSTSVGLTRIPTTNAPAPAITTT